MKKGQTALEYLMTYGWAILIVIVVVAALYSLGLTKPCRWVGTQMSGLGEVSVADIKFASNAQLTISMARAKPGDINVTNVTFYSAGDAYGSASNTSWEPSWLLRSGAPSVKFYVTDTSPPALTPGDCYMIDVIVKFTDIATRTDHETTGRVSGVIESP